MHSVSKTDLYTEAFDSGEHGLTANAGWCLELAEGVVEGPEGDVLDITSTSVAWQDPPKDVDASLIETALLLLQSDDPLRAYHALLTKHNAVGTSPLSDKAFFVMVYSLWTAGERSLQEQLLSKTVLLSETKRRNPESDTLYTLMSQRLSGGSDAALPYGDVSGMSASMSSVPKKETAYLHYLFGMVLVERGQKEEAKLHFLQSVLANPLLWLGWKGLTAYGKAVEIEVNNAFQRAGISHWVIELFSAELHLANHSENAAERYQKVASIFPGASCISARYATALYQQENLIAAKQQFCSLQKKDPMCLEGISVLSNILYLKEDMKQLAKLAQRVFLIDPYRSESQCVLGNLCSRERQSEKAITHFIRALQIDRRCQSAWTYLGHEYSPDQGCVSNTKASAFCYSKAIECEPRDYRAWLGLAQIYVTQFANPLLARYYAERSLSLKPTDSRLAACVHDLQAKTLPHGDEGDVSASSPSTDLSSEEQ